MIDLGSINYYEATCPHCGEKNAVNPAELFQFAKKKFDKNGCLAVTDKSPCGSCRKRFTVLISASIEVAA